MAPRGHQFDPSILREYDIRGIVGETLHPADAKVVGQAFGTVIARHGGSRVCLGYDGRLSSPKLEAAVADGIAATGVDVLRVGLGPTPMLYFATHALDADGGLMVTGSHNPPDHNGFKMMLGPRLKGAQAFYGAAIQAFGPMAAAGDFEKGAGAVEDRPVLDDYVDRLLEEYAPSGGLRVAWDAGNGAAGEVVVRLTESLPGSHTLLFETIDGTFPNHHPDPTVPENLQDLQTAVREAGCDLGVAFDGDGDRIGVVDGQGRILWADQLMVLFARDLLARQPGATVIADVKASQVLFDQIAAAGGRPLMYKTGHSLIKAKMQELQAPLAGEMSGHLFFADRYFGYDDGLYAAIRLLRILVETGTNLADLHDSLPPVVNTPELRFPCPADRKSAVIKDIKARLKRQGARIDGTDGVRVMTDDGWWLLRASNTQDVLVARCEAADDAGLAKLKSALADALEACGMAPPNLD